MTLTSNRLSKKTNSKLTEPSKIRLSAAGIIFAVCITQAPQALAQEGCVLPPPLNFTGTYREYPIPPWVGGEVTFTVKAGDGGAAIIESTGTLGTFTLCEMEGGKGARIVAQFEVGNDPNQIPPGSTLRFIVGGAGQDATKLVNFFSTASVTGGGGGGSAVLYKAPGLTGECGGDWIPLVVAGGGGGSHRKATFSFCGAGKRGEDGREDSSGGDGGGNDGGSGGTGGNGGGGGEEDTGGGGGQFSAGGGGSGGGAGCPSGGGGGLEGSDGGYGYGGGGGGDRDVGGNGGGGGGGGGFSGGGGGDNNEGGGGGGSYVSPMAIWSSFSVGGETKHGQITWQSSIDFFVNDFCENAIPITEGRWEGCTIDATQSTFGTPCSLQGDIWFSYTNDSEYPKQMRVGTDITGIGFATSDGPISVYDGCQGTQLVCPCNVANCSGWVGESTWTIQPGETHYIVHNAFDSSRGSVRFFLESEVLLPNPPLRAPDSAPGSTVGTLSSGLSSCFGTAEASDFLHLYENNKGIPETVTASTCNALSQGLDSVISIHDAETGTQLICDSDTCGEQTNVAWVAESDVQYLIRVAGENGDQGSYQLDVTSTFQGDTCSNPYPLSGYVNITGEIDSFNPSGISGNCHDATRRDVWFEYSYPVDASCAREIQIEMFNSSGYEIFLSCGEFHPQFFGCQIDDRSLLMQPGDSFLIRVTENPFQSLPYGIIIDDGTNYQVEQLLDFGANTFHILDDIFPDPAGYPDPSCGNTLGNGWDSRTFHNTTAHPIRVRASLCDSFQPVDSVLVAYFVGTSCGPVVPTEIACSDDPIDCATLGVAEMTFDVQPDEIVEVHMRKNTPNSSGVELSLAMVEQLPPPNDACATAEPIAAGTIFASIDGATASGIAVTCSQTNGKDIWYSYTNDTDCGQEVTFDTCGSDGWFQTVLAAYDACDGNEIACQLPVPGCVGGSTLTWTIESGETHYVRLAAVSQSLSIAGVVRIDVNIKPVDPLGFGFPGEPCVARNDACANALQLIDGRMPGTLQNATHDVNPSCAGATAMPDVWYSYTHPSTAVCDAVVSVSTCFDAFASELRSISVFDGCGGSEIVCDSGSDDPADEPCAMVTWQMSPGTTYLIRVSGAEGASIEDNFVLSISSLGAGDFDEDGVEDGCDNCPADANVDQHDQDGDGVGDACDACPGFDDSVDDDNDGIVDGCDSCPGFDNNIDADGDTIPDGCDQCPGFDDLMDTDGDGVADGCDTCPNNSPDDVDDNGICGGQVSISGTLQSGVTYTSSLDTPIALGGQPCAANIPATYDFWTFNAEAGDTITLELDRIDPDLDPEMSLWAGSLDGASTDEFTSSSSNPSQTLLVVAPDNELPATIANQSTVGDGSDPTLVGFVAPYTGTYTVLVAGNCNEAADENDYSIRLDLNADAIIRNATNGVIYASLQSALSNASSGHEIEISAGIVYADALFWPVGKVLTIRGAGPGLTYIDAEGNSGSDPLLTVSEGLSATTVISDLTLRKDVNTASERAAIHLSNTSPTIRNVSFEGNYGTADPTTGGIDITISGAASNPLIEQCVFLDNRAGFASLHLSNDASATLINCAFDRSERLDGSIITSVAADSGNLNLINCTVGGPMSVGGTAVNAVNSAFWEAPPVGIALDRCLYPGATGNSIDGVPTFVDLAGNDLRLDATSLGVDAADYDAYIANGGGLVDAGGQARTFDDLNTADTGSGALTYLDIGAYEYFIDSDGDGVGDGSDVCPGFDDSLDADADGAPDGCDLCPNDFTDDSDGDGVCDSEDVCPGLDDTIDIDNNGTPDCTEVEADECTQALSVSDGTFIGSMAVNSGSTGDDSGCAFNDNIDKWFRYVPAITGSLEVTTCNPGTEFDSILSVFDRCPQAGGVQLGCVDDSPDASCVLNGIPRKSTVIVPVTSGIAIFVRLSVYNDDFFGTGGMGAGYEISFTAAADPGGDGNECDTARNAVVGINTGTLSDNSGSTGDDDDCGAFNGIDEWFIYTATVTGTTTMSTCNDVTGFDSVLSLFDDCPANGGIQLACNNNGPDAVACDLETEQLLSTLQFEVTAGASYFVRISANFDTFEPNGPAFELSIDEQALGCLTGDVDADGSIGIDDVAPFIGVVLNPEMATDDQLCAADMNEDGNLDGRDIQAFLETLLGL